MTKAELVDRVAKDAHISKKEAALVLRALVKSIHASLEEKEGHIRIPDLGAFRVVDRKARAGVNPRSQQRIQIPAGKVARFVPFKALKAAVAGRGSEPVQRCEDVQGAVKRMLCRVCGMPVLGELSFCKEHVR